MPLIPDIHTHCLFDMHFFRVKYREYVFVHNILDHGDNVGIDYQRLFATKHRHFMHDDRAVEYITANFGPLAGMVARGHVALDIVFSYSKREMNAGTNRRGNRKW